MLQTQHFDAITLVQGETSNTVHNKHLAQVAKLGKQYGCLVIVDAVCTLSTMPLEMDNWGIDAVITGGQKGLSSIPGCRYSHFLSRRGIKNCAPRRVTVSLVFRCTVSGSLLESKLLSLYRTRIRYFGTA